MRIEPTILQILSGSTVNGNVICLPGTLDRATYERTDKVLRGLGGKWDRKARGHVFPFDPADALENAISTGSFVNRQQEYQAFYTPPAVAEYMLSHAKLDQPNLFIVEPSIGTGNLATAIAQHAREDCEIVGIDIDPVAVKKSQELGFTVLDMDFLSFRGLRFDRAIANPPFTRGQDVDHVHHMYKVLEPGGRVVSVMSERINWARDKKSVDFREFVAQKGGEFHDLPEESFKSADTPVKTVFVVIDKAA